jgi:hypothetical protein
MAVTDRTSDGVHLPEKFELRIGEQEVNSFNRCSEPYVRVSHQAVILVTSSGFRAAHNYDSFVEYLKHFQWEFPWQKVAFPLWLSTVSLAGSA